MIIKRTKFDPETKRPDTGLSITADVASGPARSTEKTLASAQGVDMFSVMSTIAEQPMGAKRITAEELSALIVAAREKILGQPDFDAAFLKELRDDPLLFLAFNHFQQRLTSGAISATPQKKFVAAVAVAASQRRFFLQKLPELLEEVKKSQEAPDADWVALGLDVIKMNGEIRTLASDPIAHASPMFRVAENTALKPAARADFYRAVAESSLRSAAGKSSTISQPGVEKLLTIDLSWLVKSLKGLAQRGAHKAFVANGIEEATRIAQAIDERSSGWKEQIAVLTIFLGDETVAAKTATEKLRGIGESIMDIRRRSMTAGNRMTAAELDAVLHLVRAAALSPKLLEEMPDLINAITGVGVDAPEDVGTPYQPTTEELRMRDACVLAYLSAVKVSHPHLDTKRANDGHAALCEQANSLVLGCLPSAKFSGMLSILVPELARHPETASVATEMVNEANIPDAEGRAGVISELAVALLENAQDKQAYVLFNSPELAGVHPPSAAERKARILCAAAALNMRNREAGKAAAAGETFLSEAHLRVPEQFGSLSTGNIESVSRALISAVFESTDTPPLDADEAVAFVRQLQLNVDQVKGYRSLALAADCIAILNNYAKDFGCQDLALEIMGELANYMRTGEGGVLSNGRFGKGGNVTTTGIRKACVVASQVPQFAPYVTPVIEAYADYAQAFGVNDVDSWNTCVAAMIGDLTDECDLLSLSKQVTVSNGNAADIALVWAPRKQLAARALEIAGDYVRDHAEDPRTEVDLGRMTANLRIEAAIRIAVPELASKKALNSLLEARKSGNAPDEAVRFAGLFYSQELVNMALEKIDDDEIEELLTSAGDDAVTDAEAAAKVVEASDTETAEAS